MKIAILLTSFYMICCAHTWAQEIPRWYKNAHTRTARKNQIQECATCQRLKNQAHSQWQHKNLNLNSNSRSDSFDIINYDVTISDIDYNTRSINANCNVEFMPKLNGLTALNLDLLRLNVDSIIFQGTNINFNYNDTLLHIPLGTPLTRGTSYNLTVYYKGAPKQDSLWGGFYFQGNYAYNMGVGFASNPHNYGRVWHPCFDNFVERATYRFTVSTTGTKRAHCNGSLISETQNGTTTTRVWQLTTPIPTYLACIAVGNYTTVNQVYTAPTHSIPIELAAEAVDTNNLKNAFQHLPNAIQTFEHWFGDYRWNKVGYSVVPFTAGAMEHATNIMYPKYALSNGTQNETLMAHELSHHWWGNLITCETAEDMWINEGMASYCEHLFLENTYGWERYISTVKSNHYSVLQNAHVAEGGYRPISGVPHEYTYGQHVYNKGAAVAHNLRWYMGDSLFRYGTHYIMSTFRFQDINSFELRDALQQSTGVDLTPFFNDWVFSGGFPHFEIDSIAYTQVGSQYEAQLWIRQKLVGRSDFHTRVPLEITFYQGWQQHKAVIVADSALSSATVSIPFLPTQAILNEGHHLNQARFDYNNTFCTAISSTNLGATRINGLTITNPVDSVYLFAQYHPVAPSPIRNNIHQYRISSNRFWTIQGAWNPATTASFRFEPTTTLDNDLLAHGTDSLLLLYRPTPNADWVEHPDYTKMQIGSLVYLRSNSLLAGDYALANGVMGLGVDKTERSRLKSSRIYPNPANDVVQIEISLRRRANISLCVIDSMGRVLVQREISEASGKFVESMPIGELAAGIYFLKIQDHEGQTLDTHRLIKH